MSKVIIGTYNIEMELIIVAFASFLFRLSLSPSSPALCSYIFCVCISPSAPLPLAPLLAYFFFGLTFDLDFFPDPRVKGQVSILCDHSALHDCVRWRMALYVQHAESPKRVVERK